MMQQEGQQNARRFLGFADTYEAARPAMPEFPVEVITRYLGHTPESVVDLGCGTGLSALVWKGRCGHVTGIEPSGDMRAIAREKAGDWFTVKDAYSHATGLPAETADAVVCSQSFHWMEPTATLREVGRLLQPGGVFATVDCDWPPVTDWQVEKAYQTLFTKVAQLEQDIPALGESFHRWEKSGHLKNIRESGQFRYVRELVFANEEPCTAKRLYTMALSQGGLQGVLRLDPTLVAPELAAFEACLKRRMENREFPAVFCYRMRIGVK